MFSWPKCRGDMGPHSGPMGATQCLLRRPVAGCVGPCGVSLCGSPAPCPRNHAGCVLSDGVRLVCVVPAACRDGCHLGSSASTERGKFLLTESVPNVGKYVSLWGAPLINDDDIYVFTLYQCPDHSSRPGTVFYNGGMMCLIYVSRCDPNSNPRCLFEITCYSMV